MSNTPGVAFLPSVMYHHRRSACTITNTGQPVLRSTLALRRPRKALHGLQTEDLSKRSVSKRCTAAYISWQLGPGWHGGRCFNDVPLKPVLAVDVRRRRAATCAAPEHVASAVHGASTSDRRMPAERSARTAAVLVSFWAPGVCFPAPLLGCLCICADIDGRVGPRRRARLVDLGRLGSTLFE